jgi:hypothetical protein
MNNIGIIVDREDDGFSLEYDNKLGKRNFMRLDGASYERAVREARAFLGVNEDDLDADGNVWKIE